MEKEQYKVKGLERFDTAYLQQLSQKSDAVYITDAYGVYKNEWYKKGNSQDRSGIVYGGMSKQDLYFLEKMKENRKLIITEFNCIGSPTDSVTRNRFQDLFKLKWSGWIGRYFESFDTTVNKELPQWLIKNYKRTHDNKWLFKNSGIAFINAANDEVVILENKTHLNNELPYIYTTEKGRQHYGMPKKIKYSFWFDIMAPDIVTNEVLANFSIDVNAAGKNELARYNIPDQFPAITSHVANDYRFFYFSADFCDNPVTLTSSYFKGISYFKWLMYTRGDALERKSFFLETLSTFAYYNT